ncbi:MAG: hypothetical protein B7X65_09670 [Polaromonas sp. 39-63-25]|nr:MAG: hypothetical protein B7Y60_12925 [Polaromonas sp. 35-63-35]OYZ19656.1 MAG: hypothetical protein B7Y28_10215 [Polaromonas sp. 16-63-31]OYZ80077.1 MAG: hypothetical protein B7Y09_06950 [Polaromonas sp. 24-63-21]OZA52194.1 MAG: hypothetical protein B7X88_05775 [Polaromonas sp. 17-63-33]OZA87774.1 MAG: hypothetical protein B7X65_09670 [Polaromonas sp. 39-63-25]
MGFEGIKQYVSTAKLRKTIAVEKIEAAQISFTVLNRSTTSGLQLPDIPIHRKCLWLGITNYANLCVGDQAIAQRIGFKLRTGKTQHQPIRVTFVLKQSSAKATICQGVFVTELVQNAIAVGEINGLLLGESSIRRGLKQCFSLRSG